MAIVGPVFLDTSVLVAGVVDHGPASAGPQRILDDVAEGLVSEPQTAWHCCLELLSVLTRLPVGYRLTPREAVSLLRSQILPLFTIHQLPAKGFSALLAVAEAERTSGGRIYDVHIAEVARLAGARTIVTSNRRHFVSLLPHGIRVLTPDEYLEDVG